MVTKPIANSSKIVIDCPILILILNFTEGSLTLCACDSVSAFWPHQAEYSLRYGGSVFEDTPVVGYLDK